MKQHVYLSEWEKNNPRPTFYTIKPEKAIVDKNEVEKHYISDGERLPKLKPDLVYYFDIQSEASGRGEYTDYYLIGYHERTITNPNYESALALWEKRKEGFEFRLEEWEENRKKAIEKSAELDEARERELYLKLKQKYENI